MLHNLSERQLSALGNLSHRSRSPQKAVNWGVASQPTFCAPAYEFQPALTRGQTAQDTKRLLRSFRI